MFYDHGILDEQCLQISRLVDLGDKLTLRNLAAFINQEGHNRLRHEITDVLLDDAEVAIDQVLNHSGLHDDSGALLVFSRAHRGWDLVEYDLR